MLQPLSDPSGALVLLDSLPDSLLDADSPAEYPDANSFLSQHYAFLLQYARRSLQHALDAEDVTQEASLKIVRYWSSSYYDPQRAHGDGRKAWAIGILRREVVNMARSRVQRRTIQERAELQAHTDIQVRTIDVEETASLHATLEPALAQLNREDMLVITMHAERWSQADMAAATGLSIPQLKHRVRVILEFLRTGHYPMAYAGSREARLLLAVPVELPVAEGVSA